MRALTMRWVCKPAAALALWCGTQVCLAQTAVVTVVDSGTGGDVGRKISGTLVAGNPAVCYADSINRTLVFARNATANCRFFVLIRKGIIFCFFDIVIAASPISIEVMATIESEREDEPVNGKVDSLEVDVDRLWLCPATLT